MEQQPANTFQLSEVPAYQTRSNIGGNPSFQPPMASQPVAPQPSNKPATFTMTNDRAEAPAQLQALMNLIQAQKGGSTPAKPAAPAPIFSPPPVSLEKPVELPKDHPWVEDKTLTKERQELRSALREVYRKYIQRCANSKQKAKAIYTYDQINKIFEDVTSVACIPDYPEWRHWKYAPRLQREVDDPIYKCRAYTISVLNIITSENFQEVSDKLLTYQFHSADDFKEMSFCLHEKALFDLRFQDLYAQLVSKLNEHAEAWARKFAAITHLNEELAPAGEGFYFRTVGPHDDPNEYNWIGPYDSEERARQQCVASFSIRKKIIDKSYEYMKAFPNLVSMGRQLEELQQRFLAKKSETGEALTPEQEQELERKVEDMDYEYQKLKKSHVANISFMGHLYKYQVIYEGMIAAVLHAIHNNYTSDPNFEIIEGVCGLLTLAGKKMQSWMDKVQKTMEEDPNRRISKGEMLLLELHPKIYDLLTGISKDNSIPFRKRAVVLDLLDLKSNNWIVTGHLGTVLHTTESLSRQEMRSRHEAEERAQREALLGKGSRGKYSGDGRFSQSQDFRRTEKTGLRAAKGASAAKGKETKSEAAAPAEPAVPSEQHLITDDEKVIKDRIKPSWENFAKRDDNGYADLYESARFLSKNASAGYLWPLTLLTTFKISVSEFIKAGQGLAFLVSQKFVTPKDILKALLKFFGGKDSIYSTEVEDMPNLDIVVVNAFLACIAAGYITFDQWVLALSSLMYLDMPRHTGIVLLGLTVDKLASSNFEYDVPTSEFPTGLAELPSMKAKDAFIEKFKKYDEVHKIVVPAVDYRLLKSCLVNLEKFSEVVQDSALVRYMKEVRPLVDSSQVKGSKDKGSKDAAYYSAQLDDLMKSGAQVTRSKGFIMIVFTHVLFEILDSLPNNASPSAIAPILAPLIPKFEKLFKDAYGSPSVALAVDVMDAIQLACICAPPTLDTVAVNYAQGILSCFFENKVTFIDNLNAQKWLDLRADGVYQPHGRAAAETALKGILGSSPTATNSPPA